MQNKIQQSLIKFFLLFGAKATKKRFNQINQVLER